MNQSRQPKGIPVGGQWAVGTRNEQSDDGLLGSEPTLYPTHGALFEAEVKPRFEGEPEADGLSDMLWREVYQNGAIHFDPAKRQFLLGATSNEMDFLEVQSRRRYAAGDAGYSPALDKGWRLGEWPPTEATAALAEEFRDTPVVTNVPYGYTGHLGGGHFLRRCVECNAYEVMAGPVAHTPALIRHQAAAHGIRSTAMFPSSKLD